MLDPQYGLVTYGLRLVGLPAVNWLGNPSVALWTLVLVTVWKTVGYPLVIYLAGLQAIPGDFYEAAALDGADRLEALPLHHLAAALAHHAVPGGDAHDRELPGLRHRQDHDPGRARSPRR